MAASSAIPVKGEDKGFTLHTTPVTPAAVLDLAKLEVNCQRMLDVTKKLGIILRAHVKTHKTHQLAALQVGSEGPANFCVSTVVEAVGLYPLCLEYQKAGRPVNILYSFPLHGSTKPNTPLSTLARLSAKLGDGAVSVFVDHPQQLKYVGALAEASGNKPLVFLKVDMGTHRAGVIPGSDLCNETVEALLEGEKQGQLVFHGLYVHAGQSYEARTDWKGLDLLHEEVASLADVVRLVQAKSSGHPLNLSVGATPTVASLQHPNLSEAAPELMKLISELKDKGYGIEVHAGVYPTLDLQQLATHARDDRFMTAQDIAISVLADVVSLYPGRGPNGTTEVLVNAGTLALARESVADKGVVPGKDYKSWGIVMPWVVDNVVPGKEFPAVHGGWQVTRTSQEHGILGWVGRKEDEVPLEIGQRVRIWPNHSCITGAGHDHYLIVDSRRQGQEDEIIDTWPRWQGWTSDWSD